MYIICDLSTRYSFHNGARSRIKAAIEWKMFMWFRYSRHSVMNQTLRWRHNERDSVSNHQPHDGLLNRLFRRRSKTSSKLRVTGLCVRNSPGTGEFPAQIASNAENVSIWWRHHGIHCKQKPSHIWSNICCFCGNSLSHHHDINLHFCR